MQWNHGFRGQLLQDSLLARVFPLAIGQDPTPFHSGSFTHFEPTKLTVFSSFEGDDAVLVLATGIDITVPEKSIVFEL